MIIEKGTEKGGYCSGAYFNAKVMYKDEFEKLSLENIHCEGEKNGIDATLPSGNYTVYRVGDNPRTIKENDQWFYIYEGNRPEEKKEETKTKQPKLSKTMQTAMDEIMKADWYYKYNGKGCEHFANENGYRPIGFERSAIVEGGYVYNQMSSSTLAALEKRGLIEIAHDGKEWIDIMKVVGMELPERKRKALHVKITRHWGESKQDFDAFATSRNAIKHLISYFDSPRDVIVSSVKIMGEVELDVWDFFANK